MKRYKYFKNFILIAFVSIAVSCTKDFLDVPTTGKLAEESFYKTDEDASQAVIAIYDILQWHYNTYNWASPWMLKNIPSDDCNTGGADQSDQMPYQRLDNFNITASNQAVSAAYMLAYYGIYRANKVINKVSPDSKIKKQSIAEAKVLRAYNYFELVSMYGGVPIVLEDLTPGNYSHPRASADSVYALIEKDLKDAIALPLPKKSEYSAADKFRVSLGTAQSLLGKVYLYQKKYTQAAAEFKKVIESTEYGLASDFSKIFLEEEELGTESIFEVMYTKEVNFNWDTYVFSGARNETEVNIHIELSGPREEYFDGGNSGLIGGWGFLPPTKKLYDAFDAADTIRRRATLISIPELEGMGGAWNDTTNSVWGFEGFFRVKYGTIASETVGEDGIRELNYSTNWRLIRYADVLLMAAEAYYFSGNEPQAKIELNKVRARAKMPEITATGTALFDAIVNERQLELAFEGTRYFDLIRWGKAKDVLGEYGYKTGRNELFPIPEDEMLNNDKLKPTDQNPGF